MPGAHIRIGVSNGVKKNSTHASSSSQPPRNLAVRSESHFRRGVKFAPTKAVRMYSSIVSGFSLCRSTLAHWTMLTILSIHGRRNHHDTQPSTHMMQGRRTLLVIALDDLLILLVNLLILLIVVHMSSKKRLQLLARNALQSCQRNTCDKGATPTARRASAMKRSPAERLRGAGAAGVQQQAEQQHGQKGLESQGCCLRGAGAEQRSWTGQERHWREARESPAGWVQPQLQSQPHPEPHAPQVRWRPWCAEP